MLTNQPGSRISYLFAIALISAGCESKFSFDKTPEKQRFAQSAPPDAAGTLAPGGKKPGTKPDNTICDPFSEGQNGQGVTAQNGLSAKLYYTPLGETRLYSALDFPTYGTAIDADIFFSQVNVPTRPFTQGFSTSAGGALKTKDGETLIEFFGLQFESKLGLTAGDEAGLYQLAVISDDGSVLQIRDADGSLDPLIVNDGDHRTRMECASQSIEFSATSRVPIQLNYYQGPRTYIAMVLLWRKVAPGAASLSEIECGMIGDSYFFNRDTSLPSERYLEMLDRGWKPIPAANFFLKETSPPNPCVES